VAAGLTAVPAAVLSTLTGTMVPALLFGGTTTVVQETAADARLEELARKVLDLRRAADDLLASLEPEERARVEARVVELAEAERADAAERAPPTPPVAEPAAAPPARSTATPGTTREDAMPTARPGPTPCAGLAAFDHDGDGIVSAIDRGWRHFYLWQDDGDGEAEEREVSSLFEHGVRALDTSQRRYSTATGFVGDLEIGEGVLLEIPARRRGGGFERGELVVDNDGLRRAAEPTVESAEGGELAGYQPLRRGYRLVVPDGRELALPCGG
jgi:hypothetical protein